MSQELLLAGADPNAVDDEGESVLHRAITKRYTECAIVVLKNGGCRSMGIVNARNKTYDYTALFFFYKKLFISFSRCLEHSICFTLPNSICFYFFSFLPFTPSSRQYWNLC